MVAHARNLPIMLALCSMLFNAHYAQNYAGINRIIGASLSLPQNLKYKHIKSYVHVHGQCEVQLIYKVCVTVL